MMTHVLSRFFAALMACALAAPAAASAPEDALARFVERVETLSADFEQIERDETGSELQSSRGHLWLQRPGRFRWEVREPFAQLVVADGETLWNYDPDLAQATRRPAREALSGTPAELLAEGTGIRGRFEVEAAEADPVGNADAVLRLLPRGDGSDFASVTLHLRDGVPVALFFADRIGGETEVRFSDMIVNEGIAEDKLRFEPPEGTQVVPLE